MTSNRAELLGFYRQILQIRRFEEEAARAYAMGKIGGFLHLYIGQEAIAVGTQAALRPEDYAVTTYRDHGIALARGMTARAGMAELFGRDAGCSRGLGGSMHFFDKEHNFLGGHAIVGGHCALAAGMAFRSKYLKEPRVAVCFFGDGAVSIGGFHEAASLAALWKLPLVLVCENNEYAMGTPLGRTLAVEDITKRADGYGLGHDRFEGHDVEVVRERMSSAVERARGGEPMLLEIKTYRFRGHSMSDPGKYRTKEELEERKKRDPMLVARASLKALGVPDAELDALEVAAEEEVRDAVEFADQATPATEESMRKFVYAGSPS